MSNRIEWICFSIAIALVWLIMGAGAVASLGRHP